MLKASILYNQATGWKLEEAIQLFYVGNEAGIMAEAAPLPTENIDQLAEQASGYFIFFACLCVIGVCFCFSCLTLGL